jgi:hypothetical protein
LLNETSFTIASLFTFSRLASMGCTRKLIYEKRRWDERRSIWTAGKKFSSLTDKEN